MSRKKLPLYWSFRIKKLKINMNWFWPTSMRLVKR